MSYYGESYDKVAGKDIRVCHDSVFLENGFFFVVVLLTERNSTNLNMTERNSLLGGDLCNIHHLPAWEPDDQGCNVEIGAQKF